MSDVLDVKKGVSVAEVRKRLGQILGKYQLDIGILVWGSTVKKSQDTQRAIRVNDDGELEAELA